MDTSSVPIILALNLILKETKKQTELLEKLLESQNNNQPT